MKYKFLLPALLFCSCTHKATTVVRPTPVPTPTTGCDTLNVTWQGTVKPIFANNCYSCHGDTATVVKGLNLEDTAGLKAYLQNDFMGDGIYGSKLLHCMMHSQGALRMPPTYKVDTCSLKQVHTWLAAGAPLS